MAPKLPPAEQRETVFVKTNIYPLEVENRIVYRYDVRIYVSRAGTSKERPVDLCKGERDEYVLWRFSLFSAATRNKATRHEINPLA
ncbi:unnamed protein product [Gongylonema pulchrum]|uniref:Transposase n=1 Tax=Gongylonema pulchrum TaxID=637853 RepID=A0A183F009_9BILA|nr:unnamed protein product [Gongylonema pulchrum]